MPLHQPKFRLLLALPALLTGCETMPKPAPIASEYLCKSWRHQTVSKNDQLTEATAAQIEGNNKSRPEWGCEYGDDRAKG